MTKKATSTRNDDRRTTRADRAQRDHYDRELRASAEELRDGAEDFVDGHARWNTGGSG